MTRTRPEASGSYLRELLGMPYTDEQLRIITYPMQPQLVVAGAGSGKTAVMAARVVHLVAWHGIAPAAVLGLTFTNKAAVELASRVRLALETLGTGATASAQQDDDEPTVSTYHAYAARLLADHALRIGREPLTTLLTEAGRWQLAVRVVNAATGPFQALEWKPPTVARYLLNLDAEMSEHLVTAAHVRQCDAALRAQVAGLDRPPQHVRDVSTAALARDELLTLVEGYRRAKADLDLVDYGDQVALAAEIAIRRPEVGALERDRYPVVVLDEYQDTGVAQRLLLAALFSGGAHPVTAVGDPCQSIYGWRGASVGNLLRFPQHFRGPELADFGAQFLMTSFRNDSRILEVANKVSAPLRESRAGSRRPHLDVPVLSVGPGRDGAGDVRCARHLTVLAEVDWVGEEIERAIRQEHVDPGQVAVLCRRRSDFGLLHEELVGRELPVEVVGLGGLLEMPEVADVVATLEVLAEPTANAALMRLLTGPRWRIGPRDLVALGHHASALVGSEADDGPDADPDPDCGQELRKATLAVDPCDVVALTDALDSLRPEDSRYSGEGLRRLRALAAELKALRPLTAQPVVEAVSGVVTAIGLAAEIEAQPAPMAIARAANLAAFLDHAASFAGLDGAADLGAFLAFLQAAGDAEDGLDIGAVAATNTIKLLTVHKAKGLEWDVVVLPGLCEEVFPSRQGRSLWTRAAKVLPYQLRGDCADLPPDPELTGKGIAAFKELCRGDELEEERRLAYVAVTRARHRLLASGYHWGLTQTNAKELSPFLEEIHDACVAGAGTVGTWVEDAGETNPLIGAAVDVSWPAPYEPLALARRRAAAQAVGEALAAGGAMPDADGSDLSEGERGQLARWGAEAGVLLAELAAASGGDRLVPLPRSLTASQVVRLAADPDGLAQSLARPMPARPDEAARRGTRFHAWVEQLFAERPLFDAGAMPGAADADVPGDEELAALQAAFARSPYAGVRPHAVEARFELFVGDRLVRGRIDAVYRTARGFDVIDYKTGQFPRNPAGAALQLAVYRLAWAGISGVDPAQVGAGFLYVRTGEVVRPPDLPDTAGLVRLLAGVGC